MEYKIVMSAGSPAGGDACSGGGACDIKGDVLFAIYRRIRKCSWNDLKMREFLKAALFYMKRGGMIVSASVSENLRFLYKLNETEGMRILRKGFEKVIEIMRECENLFACSQLKARIEADIDIADEFVKKDNFIVHKLKHKRRWLLCSLRKF